MIFGYIEQQDNGTFSVFYQDFSRTITRFGVGRRQVMVPNSKVHVCPMFKSRLMAEQWFEYRFPEDYTHKIANSYLISKDQFINMTREVTNANPATPKHFDPTHMEGLDQTGRLKPYKPGESSFE